MRVSLRFMFALILMQISIPVLADTICIKNKAGIEEAWITDDKNSGLIKANEKCSQPRVITANASVTPTAMAPQVVPGNQQVKSSISTIPVTHSQPSVVAVGGVVHVEATKVTEVMTANSVQTWDTSKVDLNMRLLIDKWAKSVGWIMIWAVDKDIPLESNYSISGNFKTAVRGLLSSTALSDYMIKPCFYTNNVIRIVKETSKCNPNEG